MLLRLAAAAALVQCGLLGFSHAHPLPGSCTVSRFNGTHLMVCPDPGLNKHELVCQTGEGITLRAPYSNGMVYSSSIPCEMISGCYAIPEQLCTGGLRIIEKRNGKRYPTTPCTEVPDNITTSSTPLKTQAASSSKNVPDNITTSSTHLRTQGVSSSKAGSQADGSLLWILVVVVLGIVVLVAVPLVIYCYKKQRQNTDDHPETPKEPNEPQDAQFTENTHGYVSKPASAPVDRGSRLSYKQLAVQGDDLENGNLLPNGRDASHALELETFTNGHGVDYTESGSPPLWESATSEVCFIDEQKSLNASCRG